VHEAHYPIGAVHVPVVPRRYVVYCPTQRAARPKTGKETSVADQTSETPVLDLLANMTAASLEASSLDPQTLMLVRIAALVAVDAPPASYLMNLKAAGELDVDAEQVRGVLAAVAPIVGTAKVASATGKIVRALAVGIEIAELEKEAAAERP
jgi:4-carboxymuconolactone decarboxylase